MMALGDGVFRFTSAENEFDLPLPRNLPPGTQVQIEKQPDGTFKMTILNEMALPAPVTRPGQPVPLPANLFVHPKTPLAPQLSPGRPVEARVVSNPASGTVRVAVGTGEFDLPLPRALPEGTVLRIVPQSNGTVQVSLPSSVSAGGAVTTPAPPAPPPAVHPSVFTVKPEGTPPQLPAGQVVEARVTATLPGNIVRFATADGEIDLPMPKAFPPGAQARIVAQPNGSFVVTMRPEPSAAPARPGAAVSSPAVQPSLSPSQPGAPAPQIPAAISIKPAPGLPSFPAGQPVDARVSAQPAPNGMVRFTAPSGDFDLPMARPLPSGMVVRVLPQANGGMTVVPLPDAPETAAPRAAVPSQTPADAVRQTVGQAVSKQAGLGNLFADIEKLPFKLSVPMPVRNAAERVLDHRLPLEFVAKPELLSKAIASSGLFAERMLAGLPPVQNVPPDLKLALFVLRSALGSWSSSHADAPLRTGPHLPPPAPGAPPAAQPPSDPAQVRAAAQMPPDEFVPRVMSETDSAIARINLHQIASLPDDRAAAARGDAPDARWSCEIPVNVDGRTAMFGFVIERDGRHAQQDKDKKKWRVRAALDLEDTGAVEADVRLQGEAVSAVILAERGETVRMLEDALPLLRDGLTAAGFEVESLYVRLGRGAQEQRPMRHFVDRKT